MGKFLLVGAMKFAFVLAIGVISTTVEAAPASQFMQADPLQDPAGVALGHVDFEIERLDI